MPSDDHTTRPYTSESDDDALFAELENEDDTSYRTQRIQQLNAELASQRTNRDESHAGAGAGASLMSHDRTYPMLDNDQAVLDFTTQTSRCIVHFAHADFARCGVMDARLEELAGRHYEVRFARVDVRNTPFLVEKLGIRVLPCVIGFKDGVGVERVVGFEGLGSGGTDGLEGFSVKVLEKRLLWKGVLTQAKFSSGDDDDGAESGDGLDGEDERTRRNGPRRTIRSGNTRLRGGDDDDDDDWD
ncbi:NTP binding protein [Penicillium hispanicum]|uniref:NTP binding protein n=1 Tax=Penicillium hispanicum TaxID=1080232 RepID=UPI00253F8EAE|nr:NTP binding protein [Penicillium hispanicum]KAJ5584068.1 NTP binding protein [Penicillium hispanicum]